MVANRLQNTLSSVYSWAVSEGLVQINPVRGLRKRHEETAKVLGVLSDDEIRAFWTAFSSLPGCYRDVLRLVLLTGQRPGECAGITAQEIDLQKGIWVIPAARAKNKRASAVPLVGEALAIVSRLAAETSSGNLIQAPRGHRAPTSQDVAKAFERMREGLFATRATPHDLRRTAATILGRLEIDRMTVGYLLNHASTTKNTITGSTYDQHDYVPQKRRALEALDAEIRRIVAGGKNSAQCGPLIRRQDA